MHHPTAFVTPVSIMLSISCCTAIKHISKLYSCLKCYMFHVYTHTISLLLSTRCCTAIKHISKIYSCLKCYMFHLYTHMISILLSTRCCTAIKHISKIYCLKCYIVQIKCSITSFHGFLLSIILCFCIRHALSFL